ncbi:hypothetical protein Tco_1525117 [Tanacetum coccineum]
MSTLQQLVRNGIQEDQNTSGDNDRKRQLDYYPGDSSSSNAGTKVNATGLQLLEELLLSEGIKTSTQESKE